MAYLFHNRFRFTGAYVHLVNLLLPHNKFRRAKTISRPPDRKHHRSDKKVAIWIPVVVAVVTGIFGLITSGVTGIIAYQTAMSQIQHKQPALLTIPRLNSSYSGYSQAENNQEVDLNIHITEDFSTGDFRGSATIGGCSAEITGVVTTANEIDFDLSQKPKPPSCGSRDFEYDGNINSIGNLSGYYFIPNEPGKNGTWEAS